MSKMSNAVNNIIQNEGEYKNKNKNNISPPFIKRVKGLQGLKI